MPTFRLLPAASLLGLLSCTSPGSAPDTAPPMAAAAADVQAIRRVLDAQAAAWNRGDVAAYMQGYWQSDSLLFIGKSGPTYGWQPTLDNYRRHYPDAAAMGQLTFGHLRIKPLSADAAEVVGSWHLARPAAGDLQGWFTLLFRNIDGQWVIVTDHSS